MKRKKTRSGKLTVYIGATERCYGCHFIHASWTVERVTGASILHEVGNWSYSLAFRRLLDPPLQASNYSTGTTPILLAALS